MMGHIYSLSEASLPASTAGVRERPAFTGVQCIRGTWGLF